MHDLTLQINLSAGDIAYAQITIPPLVEAHRASVDETVAVVDCCRPQRTKVVDPDIRFPEPEFSQRVDKICAIAEELKAKGYFDRIYYLRPDDTLISEISRKYLRNLIHATHDFRGAGLMSYLAGLEVPKTRYVIHYDADMLLYQSPGYDWSVDGIDLMNKEAKAVMAVPRVSPPFSQYNGLPDAPSLHEGRPFTESEDGYGWLNDWFCTQCFLIDRDKLSAYLPLIQGRTFLQFLIFKYIRRTLPKSPEMMLIRHIGGSGGRRLILKSEKAWLLHPLTKLPRYIELLPLIQQAVQKGQVPEEQRGYGNVELSAWENFLVRSNP